MKGINGKKAGAILMVVALFASILSSAMPVPAADYTVASSGLGTVVIDYSHGQYSGTVEYLDTYLADNLTAMGFDVVFAYGGINDTILTGAVALVLGAIYGLAGGFLSDEVTAIADWFNAGNKFLWVGGDSDYTGSSSGSFITANMTWVLESVGSHVYQEPTSIEDPLSNCGDDYRVIANGTTTNLDLAGIVEGVTAVMMHGPTLVYGSDSATPASDVSPVNLEDNTITDVYPLLYYGANATIVEGDINPPVTHTEGQRGAFVAATLELNAGAAGNGAIVVSGCAPVGDYRPMTTDLYYGYTMDGYNLVQQAIYYGVLHATDGGNEGDILFDYSHGQYSGTVEYFDLRLRTSLFMLGYNTVWAFGGINSTILNGMEGLCLGAIYGLASGFLTDEVTAITNWYAAGNKFMWVGGDSDYTGSSSGAFITGNMTWVLESVGSHVYQEPTSIEDPLSNCGDDYRVIANGTSSDPFVADIVEGVTAVMMHGPTLVYGSDSATPASDVSPVNLEDNTITDVYPFLYYGGNATIVEGDINPPVTHTEGENGAYVAGAIEMNAGADGSGVLVVTGGPAYGDYRPMTTDLYYGYAMDGMNLVRNAINFGMNEAAPMPTTTTTTTTTTTEPTTTPTTPVEPIDPMLLAVVGIGVVLVIVIIVVVVRRR